MNRIVMIFVSLLLLLGTMSISTATRAAGVCKASSCQVECKSCAQVCRKTLAYCNKQGGKHTEAAHTNALKDCASACKLSEQLIRHKSPLQNQACALCKEVCNKCAESCDQFKDDKTMKECADECRKCAQSCEKMTG